MNQTIISKMGSITTILRKLRDNHFKIDKIIEEHPEEFVEYILNQKPNPTEYELLSQYCEDRSVRIYESLRTKGTYRELIEYMSGFNYDLIDDSLTKSLHTYYIRVYNYHELSLLFGA
jgi:hypothetical protein